MATLERPVNLTDSVSSLDIGNSIAVGHVPYHSPFSKLGYNPDVNNVEEDVWTVGGTYVFPPTARGMEVVSDSDNDTSDGTGVRTVLISYLDSTYAAKTEIVTLNGKTPVPTVAKDIIRVNCMLTLTAGSGGCAAGDIDIRDLAESDTPIYGCINVGENRVRQSSYTVPLNCEMYVQQLTYSAIAVSAGQKTRISMKTTQNPNTGVVTPGVFYVVSEIGMQDQTFTIVYSTPLKFKEKSDIRIVAVADKSNSAVLCSAQYRGWVRQL